MKTSSIGLNLFKLSNQEWKDLEDKFGSLLHFASRKLLDSKKNHTDDHNDVVQSLRQAVVIAAMYTKRQVYIESCFNAVKKFINDPIVLDLEDLWHDRKKHGANKQKFGAKQEQTLKSLLETHVPSIEQPNINATLKITKKFSSYCKAVMWNSQKTMGKKISKERPIRTGLVSLSYNKIFGEELIDKVFNFS